MRRSMAGRTARTVGTGKSFERRRQVMTDGATRSPLAKAGVAEMPEETRAKMRIMLVDDEPRMHTLVARIAKDAGYDFVGAEDGARALDVYEREKPDLVILDVMMPGLDGFQVCRRLRERGATEPVIFLSAKGDIVDKGVGFDAGGDDYLVKPFGSDELAMRIGAHLRRQQRMAAARPADVVEYEGLRIDLHKRKVTKRGEPVSLTPKEFDILAILASDAGSIFTREQLTLAVWGEEYAGETLGVAVYIRRIREKLEDVPSKPVYVQTVWREGYRFGE